jgi:hypothetical protein
VAAPQSPLRIPISRPSLLILLRGSGVVAFAAAERRSGRQRVATPGRPRETHGPWAAIVTRRAGERTDLRVDGRRQQPFGRSWIDHISGDRRGARRTEVPEITSRRQNRSRWPARKPRYQKHLTLPTFVTSRNSPVTKIGTPSSSAVRRTCRAPTASAARQRLLINEIHSYEVDLENYFSERLSSAKPTTMHTSIFGNRTLLNFTDEQI